MIETFEGELNLADYKDEYQEGLRTIIDAKVAGEEVVATAEVETPTKVVDLMEALRKSLDQSARQEEDREGEPSRQEARVGEGARPSGRRA